LLFTSFLGSFPVMSEVKILCQNCQQKLAIPPELIGSEIECPSCNHTVRVTKQTEAARPSGKVSLQTQPPPLPAAASTNVSLTKDATASSSSTAASPSSGKKVINPATKTIRDTVNDGHLHKFFGLSDKTMLGLSVIFVLPELIGNAFAGILFLVISLISLPVMVFFNTLFFMQGVSWICGRHVEQTPALLTVFFTSSITSLMIGLVGIVVGVNLGLGALVISLFINAWIFELRLKEGFGKAMLVSLMIFVLNIVLLFTIGCIGGLLIAGVAARGM